MWVMISDWMQIWPELWLWLESFWRLSCYAYAGQIIVRPMQPPKGGQFFCRGHTPCPPLAPALFKVQWHQMVTFRSVQLHPGITYIFNFWHSGTLAPKTERQSARMSEIKHVGYTWMAKCNQLTSLPFKGLTQTMTSQGACSSSNKTMSQLTTHSRTWHGRVLEMGTAVVHHPRHVATKQSGSQSGWLQDLVNHIQSVYIYEMKTTDVTELQERLVRIWNSTEQSVLTYQLTIGISDWMHVLTQVGTFWTFV